MTRRTLAAVGLMCLVLPPAARGQATGEGQGPVLVIPFESTPGPGRYYWLREGAAVLLATGLENRGVDIITRAERLEVFERLQVPPVATLSHATVIRVGQLLGAGSIVYGSLSVQGETLEVRTRSIQLDTGKIDGESVDRAPLAELFDLFDRIAGRLPVGQNMMRAMSPERPPLAAFESYVKGLLAETPATQMAFLEAALKLAPEHDESRLALWQVQTEQGEHDRALATVSSIAPRSPRSRRARFLASVSQIYLERFDDASVRLRELLDETPAPAVYNNLGILRLRRAQPDPGGATYYFNKAAEIDPTEPDYRFNLGYAYALGRDLHGALYWLRQTVRLNPGDGAAHLLLGIVLKASGSELEAARERELAARLAEEALAGQDDTFGIPRGLERPKEDLAGSRTKRVDLAVIASEQRDEREVAAYHLDQGRRLFESERDREAIVELKRCLYLAPYQHEANLLLGRIYLRSGLAREAVDALTISIWSQETAAAQVALGEALLQAKDEAAARRAVTRALTLDPAPAEAQQLLQKLGGPR
jgi:tetratricopeptide (TPR) repeat protein